MRSLAVGAILAFLLGLAFAQSGAQRFIEPDDEFTVKLSSTSVTRVVVRNDGIAYFPHLGSVRIAGHELSTGVRRLNSAYEKAGRGDVVVAFTRTLREDVRFSGAVELNGSLPHDGLVLLSDIVAVAKPTSAANLDGIVITNAAEQVRIVKLTASPEGNPELQPGDRVFFPAFDRPTTATVLGEVAQPGVIDYVDNLSVRRAIALAGGATGAADLKRVEVIKPGKPTTTVDVESTDVALLPGDAIRVPAKPNREVVNVTGFVVKPGSVPFSQGLRLTAAIELAGGLPFGVKDVKIVLIRMERGKRNRSIFKLSDIYARRVANPILKPNDVIEIESIKLPAGGGGR